MNIIGHKRQINFLEKLCNNGASQVFLLIGPDMIGKRTVAESVCARLGIGATDVFRVASEVVKEKGKIREKMIGIDAVRLASSNAALTPRSGKFTAVILDRAERLTKEAQNALLKILEEPPKHALFFLISSDEGAILPTIRSRAVVVRFGFVSDNEILSQLRKEGGAPVSFSPWGRPGHALRLASDKKYSEEVASDIQKIESFPSMEIIERFSVAAELSLDRARSERFLVRWLDALRFSDGGAGSVQNIVKSAKILDALSALSFSTASARLILENLLLEEEKVV